MDDRTPKREPHGPFDITQVHPGDRYELSDGHALYAAPTGGDGARGTVAGAQVLDTDPDVDSTGIDAGIALGPKTMRAPDIAVGGVPDAPGWVAETPRLAVEYASSGQDEGELQEKIGQLLGAGTRFIWVIRLLGPRRVEVYEAGRSVRIVGPGEMLTAPGILRNAVPIEAMFDRDTAHELTLRNLLQRKGYDSLEKVAEKGREEGREKGREEGRTRLREALRGVLKARGWSLDAAGNERIDGCLDMALLGSWLERAATAASLEDVFRRAPGEA